MALTAQSRRIRRRIRRVTTAWLGDRAHPVTNRAANLLSREFTRALIARTGNFSQITWLGQPIWQNVLDLWNIQEAITELRPSLLIETGTNRGGSALFYAHLFDLIGAGRVMTVDIHRMHNINHPRIEFLVGSSLSDTILTEMRVAGSSVSGPVVVILDSDHASNHVAAELDAYHELVTPGSLLLCQDGIIDELSSLKGDRPGPLPAIHAFLRKHPEFHIDDRYNRRFLATNHPDGWLRRTR